MLTTLDPTSMPLAKDEKKLELMAEGFELESTLRHEFEGKSFTWQEPRLEVRSAAYAESQQKSLTARLSKAREALKEL